MQNQEKAAAHVEDPWFHRRPRLAVVVAVVLFVAVSALRLSIDDAREAIAVLFVLPISLLAMSHGFRVGLAAGFAAVLFFSVWIAVDSVDLSLVGWSARALPLLVVGALLGDASDRLRRAAEERRQHAVAALRHQQAVEINDTLVQGMVSAKWSFDAGRTDAGLRTLDETIRLGHELVSELIRDAGLGGSAAPEPGRTSQADPFT